MRKFEELDKRVASEVEADTLVRWGGVKKIYDETLEAHANDKKFVFFDGPATANGYPGLHHMLAKFLKDSFCKYHTMNGKKVVRKVGWVTFFTLLPLSFKAFYFSECAERTSNRAFFV